MAYIGNIPADKYQTLQKQSFTTSATDTYTLSYAVTNPQDLALFINNVRQNPNDAYTVSGTTLTLSSAITGSDTMYAVFLGRAVETVAPAIGSVTNSMLANSSITLNGSAVSLGGSATVGGNNAPILSVGLSSSQNISDNTWTTVIFDTETLDAGNIYNSSTGVATPTAGTYLMIFIANVGGSVDNSMRNAGVKFLVGSTTTAEQTIITNYYTHKFANLVTSYIQAFDGSTTVACQAYNDVVSGQASIYGGGADRFGATFQMVKLIGA